MLKKAAQQAAFFFYHLLVFSFYLEVRESLRWILIFNLFVNSQLLAAKSKINNPF